MESFYALGVTIPAIADTFLGLHDQASYIHIIDTINGFTHLTRIFIVGFIQVAIVW